MRRGSGAGKHLTSMATVTGTTAQVFDRLFGTHMATAGAELQLPRKIPVRVEPKTYFANERTFLAWIHMAVVMGFVSTAVSGFAVDEEAEHPDEHHGPIGPKTAELIQLITLPLSIIIVAYGLFTFYFRSRFMEKKQAGFFDDRFGPVILGGMIMLALLSIFIIAMVDLLV